MGNQEVSLALAHRELTQWVVCRSADFGRRGMVTLLLIGPFTTLIVGAFHVPVAA